MKIECEACGEAAPEEDMTLESVPGTTLAFCESCTKQTRAEELGLGL